MSLKALDQLSSISGAKTLVKICKLIDYSLGG